MTTYHEWGWVHIFIKVLMLKNNINCHKKFHIYIYIDIDTGLDTLIFIFLCIIIEKMPQYMLKIKKLCLDISIFKFPIDKLVQMLTLRSIGPLFLIFIISYIINEKWHYCTCFRSIYIYFFWIRTKIKSFMFGESPQRKSVFYKEVQKNSAFCPE